jgi:hemolysin activation/secretion protein
MVGRRGPGLLATAALGGLAYSAGRSGANRTAQDQRRDQEIADLQAQQAAAAPQVQAAQPPAAAAPAMAPDERIRQLRELGELKASGVLTEEEFQREKAGILGAS